MAQYADMLPGVPKIIDFIDVDSEKWRLYSQFCKPPVSLIYAREAGLLAKYEEEITKRFSRVLVVSESERHVLRKLCVGECTEVVSNGVDLEYFLPPPDNANRAVRPIVVFTGVMDYFPNVDAVRFFCKSIFPLVRDGVPGAQFYIVGRNPTRSVRKLAQQSGVVVTGTVSDVRPYLAQAAVAVAPFRLARGLQNKVLEAMAMGLPVVGTSETFKGITATAGDGIRIADDPQSFAEHVIDVLKVNPDTRRCLAKQTRSYVERNHRWDDQGQKLEKILTDVVKGRGAPTAAEIGSTALA
jgi:sugar transferase (PEP-CTERM/EpsH1 system associated)